jgi:hypothetical protein
MGKVKNLLIDNEDVVGADNYSDYEAFEAVHYMHTIDNFVGLINTYGMQTVMLDMFKALENSEVFK